VHESCRAQKFLNTSSLPDLWLIHLSAHSFCDNPWAMEGTDVDIAFLQAVLKCYPSMKQVISEGSQVCVCVCVCVCDREGGVIMYVTFDNIIAFLKSFLLTSKEVNFLN
jgi:hypothetical protein